MKQFFIILFITISASFSYSQDTSYLNLTRSIWLYTIQVGDMSHRIAIPRSSNIIVYRSGTECRAKWGSKYGLVDCVSIQPDYQSGTLAMLPGDTHTGYSTIRSGANTMVFGKLLMIAGGVVAAVGSKKATSVTKPNYTALYVGLGLSGLGLCLDLAGTGTIARGARILDHQ